MCAPRDFAFWPGVASRQRRGPGPWSKRPSLNLVISQLIACTSDNVGVAGRLDGLRVQ